MVHNITPRKGQTKYMIDLLRQLIKVTLRECYREKEEIKVKKVIVKYFHSESTTGDIDIWDFLKKLGKMITY